MSHTCVLCRPESSLRVFDGLAATYPSRFAGPPTSAHGGMSVAGLICPVLRSVDDRRVVAHVNGRINRPVPLNAPIEMKVEGEGPYRVEMVSGAETVLSGTVTLVDDADARRLPAHIEEHMESMAAQIGVTPEGPTVIQYRDALVGDTAPERENHCYGCSERDHAMKIASWHLPSDDLLSTWDIEAEQVEPDGNISPTSIVSALDCTNVLVIKAKDEAEAQKDCERGIGWLTGTHGVFFLKEAPADKSYRMITRNLSREGRKAVSIAALFDTDGTVYAVAEDILIQVTFPPAAN